jgi:hypothetical protein
MQIAEPPPNGPEEDKSDDVARTENEWLEEQDWEVRYESKKTGTIKSAMKRAIKRAARVVEKWRSSSERPGR